MDLRLIRETLAAQIRDNVARGVTVYPFDPGATRQPPCIVVEPAEPYAEYHDSDFGSAVIPVRLELVAHVVAGDQLSAAIAIDDFCSDVGSSSIKRAVEVSRSTTAGALNGLADDVVCDRVHRPVPASDTNALTATFDVRVLARKEPI